MAENYVNGVIPSIARRIAAYTFDTKLHKFEWVKKEQEYHIYILPDVDDRIIKRFKDHWPGFKVFVSDMKEA